MANEITALCITKNTQQPVLCWSPTELFSADNFGNYTHLWEISKPSVTAPAYTDPNPCGPVPPPGSNQASSPAYNEVAKLQAFGQYTGTISVQYLIQAYSPNGFQWSKDSGVTWSSTIQITGGVQAIENGVQIRFFASTGFTGTERWSIYVFKPAFTSGAYTRWQFIPFEQNLFFVNELNTLRFLNGRTINTFAWSTDSVPSGRHMVMFHDHIVISEPVINGVATKISLAWSDRRNYMKWDTQLFINEADYYEFPDDYSTPENVMGCTGLAEINPIRIGFGPPRLCFYTTRQIYLLEYVGLPHIMQKSLLNDKVGCAFPWALVASKHIHLFIGHDNFYQMEKDGEAKPIGDRVFGAFMDLLSEDINLRYMTYGYLDQARREVWWVFCSKASTGDFDTKVGYNFISDTWQFADANEHSFLHCRLTVNQGEEIQNDTDIIDTVSTPIDATGLTDYIQYRLYGQANKKVSFEQTDISQAIDQSLNEPYLMTGDIIYDPGKIVTVDGMYVHADYDPASCQGIEIAYCARESLGEPVRWRIPPKLWTREMREFKSSYPRCGGRIFRFRFTFKKQPGVLAVRKAEFFFWNEIITGLNETSEK